MLDEGALKQIRFFNTEDWACYDFLKVCTETKRPLFREKLTKLEFCNMPSPPRNLRLNVSQIINGVRGFLYPDACFVN